MDFSHILTEPYTLTLTVVAALSLVFLCLYYGLVYLRVGNWRGPKAKAEAKEAEVFLPPVSVVVTAQNDAEWLKSNLVYLLEQDYPNFEVVVVDNMSHDDTKYVLKILSKNYAHLKLVPLVENPNGYRGKKYPMSLGIGAAKNDILLFADPDCRPVDITNFHWIREMVAAYTSPKVEAVLGYCAISPKKGPFNWLQQYDNMDASAEYLGAALMHTPFTGNGRNLSYKRSLFMKNRGLIYHYRIPDGADDMFVNQNCNGKNTSVALTEGAFTVVEPVRSIRQWHSYRKHRTYTHRYYGFGLKMKRAARPLSVVLFYLAGGLLLAAGTMPWPVLAGALMVKLLWQIVCTLRAADRLLVKPIVAWLSPLMEIYFVVANTFLSLSPLPKK